MSGHSSKHRLSRALGFLGMLLAPPGPAVAESYVLPSSSFRSGLNGAEFRTDVRIINQSLGAVTIAAYFYDQVTGSTWVSNSFRIEAGNQAAFDNILESLFGRTLAQGAYGPIRFEASGPIQVGATVNNVNACRTGAVSGQWLPGIAVSQALRRGAIGQLAISSDSSSGYRTNLVFVNTTGVATAINYRLRRGGGDLLSAGVWTLRANEFLQLPVDDNAMPGVGRSTETNLWLEFKNDQPVIAYATVIHNVSGDPFAVVASSYPSTEVGNELAITLPGGVPLVMIRIPAGTFQMGSPLTERNRRSNETPHAVTLTRDYYIAKYEITVAQWKAVMQSNPPTYIGCDADPDECPVAGLSWGEIQGPYGFISRLNLRLETTKFRLPTEAEWERAARAETQTRFSFGDALNGSDDEGANPEADPYVWWTANSNRTSHPVGRKAPNAYGLYDMHGNAIEPVQDWLGDLSAAPQTDPTGPASGTYRVVRGGGWPSLLEDTRAARRLATEPAVRDSVALGIRLAMSP